jgi:hypothetical protein
MNQVPTAYSNKPEKARYKSEHSIVTQPGSEHRSFALYTIRFTLIPMLARSPELFFAHKERKVDWFARPDIPTLDKPNRLGYERATYEQKP